MYAPEPDKLQEVFFPGQEVEMESIPEQWTNICMSADKKRRASTAIGVRYQNSDYTELAEKLEIKLQKEPYVFVGLEAEGLKQLYQEQADVYIQNGIELPQYLKDLQVSENMECYYLLWQVECPKGEALRNANLSPDGVFSNDGAFVMAIYTSGGVTTFFDNFVFLCDGEDEVTQIIPVEDALQQVKKQYDNVILSEENEIVLTQIALEEVSVLTEMKRCIYEPDLFRLFHTKKIIVCYRVYRR